MNFSHGIEEAISKAVKSGQFKSVSDIEEFVFKLTMEYNQRAQPKLCNLSPEQVHTLIYSNWDSPQSAIIINSDLTLKDLRGALILTNARTLIEAALEVPVKATVAGNLNRKFEVDAWPLHILRVLLNLSGLLRKSRDCFHVAKKGFKLLTGNKAGVLYALLFKTCFQKFNLDYLDYGVDNQALQQTIAVPLYVLSKLDNTWRTSENLMEIVWLEEVRAQVL